MYSAKAVQVRIKRRLTHDLCGVRVAAEGVGSVEEGARIAEGGDPVAVCDWGWWEAACGEDRHGDFAGIGALAFRHVLGLAIAIDGVGVRV